MVWIWHSWSLPRITIPKPVDCFLATWGLKRERNCLRIVGEGLFMRVKIGRVRFITIIRRGACIRMRVRCVAPERLEIIRIYVHPYVYQYILYVTWLSCVHRVNAFVRPAVADAFSFIRISRNARHRILYTVQSKVYYYFTFKYIHIHPFV